MRTIRVFLSSPGDVAEERRLAIDTMRALEDSPLLRDRVNLQVIAWDDPVASAPLDARETPQASVNRWTGRPADCDLTVVILWSRLGTPLPASLVRADGSRFASGTVWEVEDAIAGDRPVFVYRRTEKPRIELDDPAFDAKRAQYDAVRRWFDTLRDADGASRSGINEYATPAQFQTLLRTHLEAFIGRLLATDRSAAAPDVGEPVIPSPRPSPAARPPRGSDSPSTAAATPTTRASNRPRRFAAAGVGVLLVGALAWLWRSGDGSVTPPDAIERVDAVANAATAARGTATDIPPAAPAAATALPRVQLAGPSEATFSAMRGSTYTVLAATPEAGNADRWRLRLRLRLATGTGSGGMNFWDSSFRLLVDGVPRAPESTLNEVVESGAAKDGELVFSVPWAVGSLALRVLHYGDAAELPFTVNGTRSPTAVTLPEGPRRVTLDGPAELSFPRSPRAAYTVLAIGTEARRPGVFGLRLRLRMQVIDNYSANFGDAQFRLLVDGVPREPDSGFNKVVGGGAAEDGDITFEVPDGARQLALRVIHTADLTADVPLTLAPAK